MTSRQPSLCTARSLAGLASAGLSRPLAYALNNLGMAEEAAGETDHARRSFEESITLCREGTHKAILAIALASLGHLEQTTAQAEALAHYSESLEICREIDDPRLTVYCLQGGAAILAARGDLDHAATMLAAAATIRARTGNGLPPDEQAEVDVVEANVARRSRLKRSPAPGTRVPRSTPMPPPTGRSSSGLKGVAPALASTRYAA